MSRKNRGRYGYMDVNIKINDMDKDTKRHIVLTTDIFNYTYTDYLEYCEEYSITPNAKNSPEFFNWCHEQVDSDLKCDCENIRCSEYENRHYMVTGSLGLWDGSHKVRPRVCYGLVNTIMSCTENQGIEDFDVFINEGEDYITVHAKHHDGTNIYEIHLLKHGEAQKWEDDCGFAFEVELMPKPKPEMFEAIVYDNIF